MLDIDSTGTVIQVDDLDHDWLLALCEDAEAQARAAEARKLRLAAEWGRRHPADPDQAEQGHVELAGGPGCPPVEEFTAEPLGAALQITTHAAQQLLADALDLTHRLPRIWARVQTHQVPAWRARRIAQATHHLTPDQAAAVDTELADRASTCGVVLIDRAVAAATAEEDPAGQEQTEVLTRESWDVRLFHGPLTGPGRWVGTSILEITGDSVILEEIYQQICGKAAKLGKDGDPDSLGARKAKAVGLLAQHWNSGRPPRTRLYLHADYSDLFDGTTGVGSVERLGPASIARIKDWVGHTAVTILPVLRETRTDAVDQHDPPAWMQELVILRDPHCVFPWCHTHARACDLDHITPYVDPDHGGPPGQTHPDNLAPLCRRHHRAKTRRRWTYHRNPDGSYTWTGPLGRTYQVTPTGTTNH